MWREKIIDILNFRIGTEEEADGSLHPIVTSGSAAFGILLRSALVMALAFATIALTERRDLSWLFLFLLWGGAVYPGWKQYQAFEQRIKKIEEETICGSCKYFDEPSQLCRPYDEHISKNYIPCEGKDWEAKKYEN